MTVKSLVFGEYEAYDFTQDISWHGDHLKVVAGFVTQFLGMVGGTLLEHVLTSPDPALPYMVQIAAIRGRGSRSRSQTMDSMPIEGDYFTWVNKDPSRIARGAMVDFTRESSPVYGFASEEEANNFVKYLQTDFARFVLSVNKVNAHIDDPCLGGTPWLDFKQGWDDAKLFNHFRVPALIKEYAKRFLPDYHNIYPNGKTY